MTREPDLLQIGEVADRVGLSLRTVRYYEELGLLSPTGRTQGGFRLYSDEDVERLRVLKGMKPLGLSLEEVRELMELFDRTADIEELGPDDLDGVVEGLDRYARLGDERVEKLEQHLAEARRLRAHIRAELRRSASRAERLIAARR